MFTLDQIHTLHSKVKSGADFPQYVQDLIGLGVRSYEIFVADGSTTYWGLEDFQLKNLPRDQKLVVNDESSGERLRHVIKIHQAGQTDYPTFCAQAAEAGVEKWTLDLDRMKCIYFDKAGQVLVSEDIPTP